ncbi:hypothetical protein DIPPA_11416 [Diplonema papillatum]|nr:hypothetical protein DIPPA_11416 [Diplonema papillatum]
MQNCPNDSSCWDSEGKVCSFDTDGALSWGVRRGSRSGQVSGIDHASIHVVQAAVRGDHVEYRIESSDHAGTVVASAWRRFRVLHLGFTELRKQHPRLPHPPKKLVFQRLHAAGIEARRADLDSYIQAATEAVPEVRHADLFQFLVGWRQCEQGKQLAAGLGSLQLAVRTALGGRYYAKLKAHAQTQQQQPPLPADARVYCSAGEGGQPIRSSLFATPLSETPASVPASFASEEPVATGRAQALPAAGGADSSDHDHWRQRAVMAELRFNALYFNRTAEVDRACVVKVNPPRGANRERCLEWSPDREDRAEDDASSDDDGAGGSRRGSSASASLGSTLPLGSPARGGSASPREAGETAFRGSGASFSSPGGQYLGCPRRRNATEPPRAPPREARPCPQRAAAEDVVEDVFGPLVEAAAAVEAVAAAEKKPAARPTRQKGSFSLFGGGRPRAQSTAPAPPVARAASPPADVFKPSFAFVSYTSVAVGAFETRENDVVYYRVDAEADKEEWTEWVRYSAFCDFRDTLADLGVTAPHFPTKMANLFASDALESRRNGLDAWLRATLSQPIDAESLAVSLVDAFLRPSRLIRTKAHPAFAFIAAEPFELLHNSLTPFD